LINCWLFLADRVLGRASQFSRYLLERAGISDKDKNARPDVAQLIKYSTSRAFLASFKKRELRSPSLELGHRNSPVIYLKELAFLIRIQILPRIFGLF
jgi:hypothetical protein